MKDNILNLGPQVRFPTSKFATKWQNNIKRGIFVKQKGIFDTQPLKKVKRKGIEEEKLRH